MTVVDAFDPTNPTMVTTLSGTAGGSGATVNPNTNRFYTSNGFTGQVLMYDGATNALLASTSIGACPGNFDIDLTTNLVYVVRQCGGGGPPLGVDPLYVLHGSTFTIVGNNLGSGGIVGKVRVNSATHNAYICSSAGTTVLGPSPNFSLLTTLSGCVGAVNPVTNRLYFNPTNSSDIQVLDGNTHALIATIAGAGTPEAINTALNHIYAVNGTTDVLNIINGVTNTIVASFSFAPVGENVGEVAADSINNRVYVTATVSSTATVVLFVIDDPPEGAFALLNGGNTFTGNQSIVGNVNATGSILATSFTGSGAGLTGVNAATLGGLSSSAFVQKAGDTMTGTLNLPANGLAVGGTQLVASGGNVGIGTTSPQAALHVNGNTLLVTSATTAQVQFAGTASEARFGQDGSGAFFASDTPGKAVRFYTNNGTLNEGLRVTSAGNVGIGTASPSSFYQLHVVANTNPAAIFGQTSASGGFFGVGGESLNTASIGVLGQNFGGGGVPGFLTFNIGVAGQSNNGIGVEGSVETGVAVSGRVGTSTGTIFTGVGISGAPVFRVDSSGKGFFDGGTQMGGADFAESLAVRGRRGAYEAGDLLVIDSTHDRRLALSSKPYSRLVAGIYSSKPGVLATAHDMDSAELSSEVPLAVVGIVPCKVSAENGPILRGDLLVSSSTLGHAMKGTDRRRMLGAVVGKALQPLPAGKGVIQVLVTLQ